VKLKAFVGALVVGALGAAVAFAAPPPGKGPHHGSTTTGSTSTSSVTAATTTTTTTHGNKPACTPQVAVVVKGTASADVGTSSTVSLNVTGGNHFAKLLFHNNTTTSLSLNTTSSTQVTTASGGASTLSSIKKGDRVLAMYKLCRSSITGSSVNVASASALSSFLSGKSPKKVVDLGAANGQD
jgi:hypothetical protein